MLDRHDVPLERNLPPASFSSPRISQGRFESIEKIVGSPR